MSLSAFVHVSFPLFLLSGSLFGGLFSLYYFLKCQCRKLPIQKFIVGIRFVKGFFLSFCCYLYVMYSFVIEPSIKFSSASPILSSIASGVTAIISLGFLFYLLYSVHLSTKAIEKRRYPSEMKDDEPDRKKIEAYEYSLYSIVYLFIIYASVIFLIIWLFTNPFSIFFS